jgi:hypothetical protein
VLSHLKFYTKDGDDTFFRKDWQVSTRLHDVTSQKTVFDILIAGRKNIIESRTAKCNGLKTLNKIEHCFSKTF